jgi:predicted thioesterase
MTDLSTVLRAGVVSEAEQEVTIERSATHIGSGSMPVYATPAMVAFVETTCLAMVEPLLSPGETTVGVFVEVHHLAPTPLGEKVRIRAEVLGVERNTIEFRAEVWDQHELVGEARHRRAAIDVERFLKRVRAKTAGSS